MEAEKKPKAATRKKTRTKIFLLIPGLITVLILLLLLLAPAFVSSGKGSRLILRKINNSIDGEINFAGLSMGWLKGVRIADFSFNDNAGQISVQVKELATEPHYGSILSGNLSFGQTTVDTPRVQINLKEQTTKDTSPDTEPQRVPKKSKAIALVMDVDVKDGNLKITDPQSQTVEVSNINSKVSLRPPGQQSSFEMEMAIEGKEKQATLQANGRIKPAKTEKGWSLKGTTGELTVEVNDLDLESLGPFFALAGVEIQASGIVQGNLKSNIVDGNIENLNTGINAKDLDISGAALKGDRIKTNNLDINAMLNQSEGTINVDDLQIKSDWASVAASGVVPMTAGSFGDFLKVDSGYDLKGTFDCDLPAVMSQLPNTIGLKEGTRITSGQLSGNIETITQAGQKQIHARATVNDLKGTVEEKPISMSEPLTAQAQISSNKAGININKLDVSASFARINCTGSTEMMNYNADVDLSKLQAELGQFLNFGKYKMAGQFLGNGNVSFKDKITAAGSTQINNMQISTPDGQTVSEPEATLDFAVELDKQENLLAINTAKTDASFGSVTVKDSIVPLNQKAIKPMNLTVNATDFDLAKILPFAVMFGSLPKEMKLSGIGESEIQLTSENNIYHIVTEKTNFKDFEFIYPGEKPFKQPDVSIVADIKLDTIEKIPTGKFDLISDIIKISLNINNQKKNDVASELKGNAELEYDWSTVNAMAAPYLPEGLNLEGQRKDSITFSSEYPTGQTDQIMANLNAAGKVGFNKAEYMGLNFGATDVDIQVQNGLLKVAPFTTPVNEGQIDFAANIDFNQDSPVVTTPQPVSIKGVNINESVAGSLLKYVNPLFANSVGAKGVANFSAEKIVIPLKQTDKNKIQVIGAIGIDDIQLKPTGLLGELIELAKLQDPKALMKLHSTSFTIKDGVVHYNNIMQIDIGNTPTQYKGSIGLNKQLDMQVAVPMKSVMERLGLDKGSTETVLWLPLTGTIDKPKLDKSKLLETTAPTLLKGIFDSL